MRQISRIGWLEDKSKQRVKKKKATNYVSFGLTIIFAVSFVLIVLPRSRPLIL